MIKKYQNAQKMNANSKDPKNKIDEKSIDITKSIDLSQINKKNSEQSTNVKQYIVDSNNKNDESVYAPAFILGEKDPEWDSFLDDTKVHVRI